MLQSVSAARGLDVPPSSSCESRCPYTEVMSSREYEVVLTPEEEGGYSVTVPALPGCISQGQSREEALAMIREAIELYIESLEAHGDPIPGPIEIERVTVSA